MSKKVASAIAQGRRLIYASIPVEIRALHAIIRIARVKVSFSKSDINRIVAQMMDKDGVTKRLAQQGLPLPDIDYGTLFHVAVNTVGRRFRFSQQQREDYLNDVVGDMIMGKSIITLRGTGSWKYNLTRQVEAWVTEGWNDTRIKGTLVKWISDKVMNLLKRERAERGPVTKSLEPGRPQNDKAIGIYEGMFSMDGLTKSEMSQYHQMLKENPDARRLVEKIQQVLDRKDDVLGYIWQAYKSDPSATIRELAYIVVNTPQGPMKLWNALGYSDDIPTDPAKTHHHLKKLRKYMKAQWPAIEEVLAEV